MGSFPNFPNVPNIPSIPNVPNIPSIPNMPNIPDMSDFLQNMPSLEDFTSGLTQEEVQRLGALAASNQNFQRELVELQKSSPESADYKQLIDKYLNANPNVPSLNNPNMVNRSMGGQTLEESMSGLSPDEQAAMQTFLTSPDFQKEYAELQEKYVNSYNTDAYKQEKAALINRYSSGAGLVVSLVTLVASLVVQGLMMFG